MHLKFHKKTGRICWPLKEKSNCVTRFLKEKMDIDNKYEGNTIADEIKEEVKEAYIPSNSEEEDMADRESEICQLERNIDRLQNELVDIAYISTDALYKLLDNYMNKA